MPAGTSYLVWLIYCLTIEVIWLFISKAPSPPSQSRKGVLNSIIAVISGSNTTFVSSEEGQAKYQPCSQIPVPQSCPSTPSGQQKGGRGKLGWERNWRGAAGWGHEWNERVRERGRKRERDLDGGRKVPNSCCHVTGDLCPPFKSFPS